MLLATILLKKAWGILFLCGWEKFEIEHSNHTLHVEHSVVGMLVLNAKITIETSNNLEQLFGCFFFGSVGN